MGRSQIEVPGPALLVLAGGVGWLLGSGALDPGAGTVVLAVGLGATVWLFGVVRGRAAHGVPAHPRTRRRVLRLLGTAAAAVVAEFLLLGLTPYGELAAPLAAAIIGASLLPLASLLDTRTFLVAGGGLIVLGAAGALYALNSGGAAGPLGLVGMGGALLLWGAAAAQVGLLAELRDRVGR